MKRLYKIFSLLTAVTLVFASCSAANNKSDTQPVYDNSIVGNQIDSTLKGEKGFVSVAENDSFELFADGVTANIQVKIKETGVAYYTCPINADSDPMGQTFAISQLKSQLIIDYLDSTDKSFTLNSYDNCIINGDFTFAKLDNGVRVSYTLREDKKLYIVPVVISKARFEKFFSKMDAEQQEYISERYNLTTIAGLSSKEAEYLLNDYPSLKNTDLYILVGDSMANFVMEEIADSFQKAGYTINDLALDNSQNYQPAVQLPAEFLITVDYLLTDEGLEVKIPRKYLSYSSFVHLTKLSVLNGFGAAGTGQNGYIFVPDGSGALLELNSGNTAFDPYEQPVYGQDYAIDQAEKDTNAPQIHLPVFGIKEGDNAFLTIIKEGAASALIRADTSGRNHSYNTVYASFETQKTQLISPLIDAIPPVHELSKQIMECDIVLLYKFLHNENANYTGMALCYQQYLVKHDLLKKTDFSAELPFMLNLIGAVDYKTSVLFIPAKRYKTLTSYTQAIKILSELKSKGVAGINVRYLSWANGGFNNSLNNEVDLLGAVGSQSDLKKLTDYNRENDIGFYPDTDFLNVQSPSLFSFYSYTSAAKTLTNDVAYKFEYDRARNRKLWSNAKTIIKPARVLGYMKKFVKKYNKLDIDGISVSTMGYQLSADYSRNGLERNDAVPYLTNAYDLLKDNDLNILSSGANDYTLKYLCGINNIPMESGKYSIFSRSVPFYQILVHGYIPYSTSALNFSSDYEMDFLKAVEYGANISFEWTYSANSAFQKTNYDFYGTDYTVWIDDAARKYQKISTVLAPLQKCEIVAHDEIADKVFKTKYSNGTAIYVNYNSGNVDVDGITVPARGYISEIGSAVG